MADGIVLPEIDVQKCYLCTINLAPEASEYNTCLKCNQIYCNVHASKVDVRYCQHCVQEVIIKDEVFVRTEEEYDEINDKLIRHTEKCRDISFSGVHWAFLTKAIAIQTDEELKNFIEYHRAMVALIEQELLTRKINKMQEGIRLGATTLKIRRTTEKKSKTVAKQEPVSIEQLIATLKAAGVTADQLQAFLGKK